MAYSKNFKRTYESKDDKEPPSSSGSGDATASNETTIDLGKNKRITIRRFKTVNLVDIREFYEAADGELKPGKKGISLTEDQWNTLLSKLNVVDDALSQLGGGVKKQKTASTSTSQDQSATTTNSDNVTSTEVKKEEAQ